MTPSELNEIWCVGSSSGLMYPKGISPKLLVRFPRNALLNIFLFCSFAMHIFIQSIITWTFFKKWFVPLQSWKNKLSFNICKSLVWWLWHEPCFLTFTTLWPLIYQKVLIKIFCQFLWILAWHLPISCTSFILGSLWDYEICTLMLWYVGHCIKNPIQYCTPWSQMR